MQTGYLRFLVSDDEVYKVVHLSYSDAGFLKKVDGCLRCASRKKHNFHIDLQIRQ